MRWEEGWKKRRGKDERMEVWKGGRMEGWKGGRMEGWKVRGLYGWKKEAQSRMNVLQLYQDGWGRGKGMRDEGVWRKKHNLTECATNIETI